MNLETADGKNFAAVTEEELLNSLSRLDPEMEFLILSDGDDYLQCAVSEGGFLAEYQDSTGHYYSRDVAIPHEAIEKLFLGYLNRDGSWKSLLQWDQADEEGEPESAGRQESLGDGFSPSGLIESVKKQAAREVKRAVSRKTSGALSRLIGKIIK